MTTLSKYVSSGFLIKTTTNYATAQTDNWIKSGGVTGDSVVAVVIGGGGSGARGSIVTVNDPETGGSGPAADFTLLSGGGGGGVSVIAMPYEDCPSSVSIVVGYGGAARSTSGTGNAGANSSFGAFAIGTGGQGGPAQNSGGTWARGGSSLVGTSTNNANETAWSNGQRSTGGDSRYVQYSNGDPVYGIPAGLTGGGGSLMWNGTIRTGNATGRKGSFFGEGGDAGTSDGAAGNSGGNPGGGGGASYGGNSGAGGTGAVRIYVVQGFASAGDILLRAAGTNYTALF